MARVTGTFDRVLDGQIATRVGEFRQSCQSILEELCNDRLHFMGARICEAAILQRINDAVG
jgi:hypothetical protein